MIPIATTISGSETEAFLTGSGTTTAAGQLTVDYTMKGAGVAGSFSETNVTQNIFVADANYQVVAVLERHSVLGSTNMMLVHAIGSTPMGSAANVLASTIPGVSAVDVYNSGTILASTTLTNLAAGDGLGIRWSTANNLPPTGVFQVTLARI